jgi:glycosyltransferase involved in cell wall biosynthesis
MILGLLRIKNESRWIEKCISSILPLCDQVFAMDDHSEDDTAALCAALPNVSVLPSPFEGLNECRDKQWLLDRAMELKPEWIVFIDGDEMLAPGYVDQLRVEMRSPYPCLSLRVLYLWDSETQVRVDGVYGDFHRESVFRPNGSRFETNSNGGNFHCGNVPWGNRQHRKVLDIPLLHFGYLHREDRINKYHWYNRRDPENAIEDSYRHMVVGDIFPANSRFTHGGPLRLAPL